MSQFCPHCKQQIVPTLTEEEYNHRAIMRLKRIDRLWEKIQRDGLGEYSTEYETYNRLMAEQAADEQAAGF